MLDLSTIDKTWSLFLDRDGVINIDKSPYTLNEDQFEFYPGVPDSIASLSRIFNRIIVVTNQRGIGRQLMTEDDLGRIHLKMINSIEAAGGRIDHIYYCTATDNSHPDRKPNPGMALRALHDYPDIAAEKSIIVGNNISDMQFGKNAGFNTVLVGTTGTKVDMPHPLVDMQCLSLPHFAELLLKSSRSQSAD